MKKIILALFAILLTISCEAQSRNDVIARNAEIDTNKVIAPGQDHSMVNLLVSRILENHHYRQNELNDSLSAVIFDNYIDSFDPNKYYFLKEDMEVFENFRYSFDDFLKTGKLDIPYEIFNLYKQRLKERVNSVDKILANKFDFSIDEKFTPDREDSSWAKSSKELDEIWRKRLKSDALNLKLSDREWDDIVKSLKKRYSQYFKIILRYHEEDIFQLYMNAFATAIDPHTNYFSPIDKDNFAISMSNSLEGIGATLRYNDGYVTIVSLVPGGPAYKSEALEPDDRIVSVGQEDDGEMVDIVEWRTDDAVQLIRGKKGTKVKLEILKAGDTPDMPTKVVTIERDKIKLEEQGATKEVIEVEEAGLPYKLGVIKVPKFYVDFAAKSRGEADYTSTTRDVKKLVNELKKENVDGIIIDLRNNGGGSLQEAIDLTGLFIETGPVVQVRESNGQVEVGKDYDKSIIYNGPLAVLVNTNSASASEIFSGAIQDYDRGIVVGNTTHGKGTVQNLIDLKRFIRNPHGKTGQLKLTIAKYYRITGSSTQHKGVVPDIKYPSVFPAHDYGESSYPSALPWDEINPTNFEKYNSLEPLIGKLREKHLERIEKNPEFQYLMEDIEEYKENRKKKSFSLKEDIRKAEREAAKKKREKRDEERALRTEIKTPEKKEVETKSLNVDDPLLEETGHILADLIKLTKG